MAKISARGDSAQFVWKRSCASRAGTPYQMMLTKQGRLLYKSLSDDGWKLRRRGVTEAQAFAQAAMFNMEVR